MVDFVGLGILLLLTLLFGYLVIRSWGSKNAVLKWGGLILSCLLTLLFGVVFLVALMGTIAINQNYNASHPAPDITIAGTPEQLARGEKLATTCTGCHGSNGGFPLTGNDFAAEGPPIGIIWSANLTPNGEIADWTDGEVVRALREGVHQSGRSLFIMPSVIYHNFSDEDAQAIVAYLRSQEPAGERNPPTNLNLVGAILVQLLGPTAKSVQPHITQPVPMPPVGVNMEYGQYMMVVSGCSDCHGKDFTGGMPPPAGLGPPVGPPIRGLGARYTEEQFINLFRTGMRADGNPVDMMPVADYKSFSDDDFKAMYMYLTSLSSQ
jgi:cytochrome c553